MTHFLKHLFIINFTFFTYVIKNLNGRFPSQAVSPTLDGPLSRATRRQSLSEIGFGRMDTYTKLDKLGEVTQQLFNRQSSVIYDA
jgi:hypothetical protein